MEVQEKRRLGERKDEKRRVKEWKEERRII